MGKDIHTKIYKYNINDNKWHELILFRQNNEEEMIPVDIYPYRNYYLFDILSNDHDDEYGDFPNHISIHINSYADAEKEQIEKIMDTSGCYNFNEVSVLAMKYYLKNAPKVKDYDVEWGEDENGTPIPAYCDNPVKDYFDAIMKFIEFASPRWILSDGDLEEYRVFYYFDC